jgi:outer membrane receptor protein involved in Fe transport
VAVAVQPAEAAERRISVDIPAGPLARGLEALAGQAGISVGRAGRLPDVAAPALRGRMTVAAALERLLAGTGLKAVPIAPGAYRLVPAPAPRSPRPAPRPPRPGSPPAQADSPALPQREIVVTGLRRSQGLFTAPASIAVVPVEGLPLPPVLAGAAAIAGRVNGLTLTNLGAGRNRQFIRGVADSAFDGYSQSTVAIVVDGARVTYDAPDPDLRLVDVARVEVLKGPQGPLYGSGALGGVYHIVTNRPDPSVASASVEAHGVALASDRAGGGGSLVLNLPLVEGRLGLRASAYGAVEPGWIDETGGRRGLNVGRVSGGRAALRWLPAPGWTLDLATAAQFITVDDSQYVPRPGRGYQRPPQAREPHDNDFRMAAAQLSGAVGSLRLDASASLVRHEVASTLDAGAAAAAFGEAAPLRFRDDRRYRVSDEEVRLSGKTSGGIGWIVGASYLAARTSIDGLLETAAAGERRVVSLSRQASEAALYGQAAVPLGREWGAELGLRLFRSTSRDELEESDGNAAAARLAEAKTGISPSLSLAWSPDPNHFLFARIARAERGPGLGAQVNGAPVRFGSDRLTSYEVGGRARMRRIQLDGALFHAAWRDMQSDYLLPEGLIATHNAGDAEIWGAELSGTFHLAPGWTVESGAVVQRARLVRAADGAELPDDRRLPVVPMVAARLGLARSVRLGPWTGSAGANLRFNGAQRLSFDPGLDRRSPAYALVDASIRLGGGGWTFAADLTNLLGSRTDSFGFGNPFSIRAGRQSTPLPPRGVTLSLKRTF